MKPKERIPGRSRPVVYRWGVRHISGEGVSWGFAFAKHGVAQAVSIKPEGIIPEGGGGSGPCMLNARKAETIPYSMHV